MYRRKLWIVIAILITQSPRALHADTMASVEIELNQAGRALADELHLEVGQLEDAMRTGVLRVMDLASVEGFLRAFSDATSFSNRGLGADYASNSEGGVAGVAGALALASNLDGDVSGVGAAANLAVMAGLNLRRWGHPEFMIYGNAFWRSMNERLSGSIVSFGAHVQYKIFTPTEGWKSVLVQWGGIDLTSGFEVAHWGAALDGQLSHQFPVEGAMGEMTAQLAASLGGHFDLSSTTVTVPIEITTNLRLLYVASIYVGVGAAAQVGSATVDVGVNGELTARRASGAEETVGALRVNAAGSQEPLLTGYHVLAGIQANLWRLKLFAQATVEPFDRASVAFGMRVVL